MQFTFDIPDEIAEEIFSDVPAIQRGEFLLNKLIKNMAIFKKNSSSKPPVDEFVFALIPPNGTVVTNDLVNQIREQEGI